MFAVREGGAELSGVQEEGALRDEALLCGVILGGWESGEGGIDIDADGDGWRLLRTGDAHMVGVKAFKDFLSFFFLSTI